MENVILNFVGKVDDLKPAETSLDSLVKKEGEVGEAWKKASDAMTSGTKQSVESSTKLSKAIDNIAIAAKSMDKAIIGGAYKDYLKQLQAQLQLTNKEVTAYIQNAKRSAQEAIISAQTQEEADQLTLSIQVMNEQLEQFGATEETTGSKTQSLRARIREAKEELVAMAEAGLAGTPAFTALQRKAGELDDEMRDLNQTVKGLGSDTRHLDGLISLAGGVAGGFAVAQGAAALFGSQNEEVQKALLKVNAAMSILQGLQQIQNVLQKESAASLLFNTAATETNKAALVQKAVAEATAAATAAGLTAEEIAQAAATAAVTAEQEALNTTMLANPVGIVILSVLALIQVYNILTDDSKEVAAAQAKLNAALKEGTEILDGNLQAVDRIKNKRLADAKEQGASVLELARIEGKAGNDRLVAIAQAQTAVAKQLNDAKSNNKLTADEYKKLLDKKSELDTQYQNERAALEVKAVEFQKTKNDEALKSFIGYQEARVAATIAGSDAERSTQIEAIRAIAKERANSADFKALTPGEQAKQEADDERQIRGLQLANYQHYLKGRTAAEEANVADAKLNLLKNETDTIESINRITDLEIAALKKRKDEAIKSDPNLNSGETRKIVEETNLQIAELEKQKQLKILDIQKAGINTRLILAKKGTEDEYNDKVNLISKEQEIELAATEIAPQKRAEIEAKYQKQREDALRSFNEAQLQNNISNLNGELDAFGINETQKLALTLQRLNEQRKLEISQADENASKIAEVNAKYDKQIIDSRKAMIEAVLQETLRSYDADTANSKAANERIIAQDKYTLQQKKDASAQLLKLELDRLQMESNALGNELIQRLITQQQYDLAVQEINNKRTAATIKNEETITAATLKEIDKRTSAIQAVFSIFQKSLQETLGTSGLSVALTQLQNFGVQVQDVMAKIKEGTLTTSEGLKQLAVDAITGIQDTVNQMFADSSAARQQALADAIAGIEEQKAKEVDNKNLTEQQKADIDKKYQERERQLKIQAFNADKQAKIEQAGINAALAITQAFATNPFPYDLIVAGIVAAATAIQIAKIKSSQPPKFRHGEIDIQGPGTTTSDSIVARISKGESVIKADSTAKWKDALKAINNDKFEHYLSEKINGFIFPQVPEYVQAHSPGNTAIDYDKLSNAIADKLKDVIPAPAQVHTVLDKNGFRSFVIEGNNKTELLNERYSMS